MHPLDGLAINVRSIGPELDRQSDVTGSCFGKDGTATNLIKVHFYLIMLTINRKPGNNGGGLNSGIKFRNY